MVLLIYVFLGKNKANADVPPTPPPEERAPVDILTATPTVVVDMASLNINSVKTVNPKVLMYHHIGSLPENSDAIRQGLTVSKENFESQIQFLTDNGFKISTLSELYEMLAKNQDVSNVVVLTFDDGYDDNFSDAWAVMKKHNVKGTFFIITDKIETDGYMNKSQIVELKNAGNEIGSHTATHPSLDKLVSAKINYELRESKTKLEDLTQGPIYSFCYPAGKYSEIALKELPNLGYKIAVTTQAGKSFSTEKIFELPRYRVNPSTKIESLLK